MDGWFTCSGAADDDAGFGERGCSGSGRVDKLRLALGFFCSGVAPNSTTL
jgi:hypothetical protein